MNFGTKYVWYVWTANGDFVGLYETAFGAFCMIWNWAVEVLPSLLSENEVTDVLEGLKYDYVHCALNLKKFGIEDYIYARPEYLKPAPERLK